MNLWDKMVNPTPSLPLSPHSSPPLILKKPKWIVGLLLAVSFSPGGYYSYSFIHDLPDPLNLDDVSYWISSPTAYFVIGMSDETIRIMKVGRNSTNGNPTPQFKQLVKTHNFSNTGFSLMTSLVTSYHSKLIRRDTGISKIEKQLDFLEDLLSIMELKKSTPSMIMGFNPLSYLNPVALMEITLVYSVSLATDSEFFATLSSKILKNLDSIHKELHSDQSYLANPSVWSRISRMRERVDSLHQTLK